MGLSLQVLSVLDIRKLQQTENVPSAHFLFLVLLKVAEYVRTNEGRGTANQISRVLDQYVTVSGYYEH